MRFIILILSLVVFFTGSVFLFAQAKKKSNDSLIGQKAPDFTLPDENGDMRSLSEFRGKKVVLYFYPKDDTPGCTKEACSFRDNYDLFAKNGIVVIGISYDSPESHKKFKEKYHLPFILLSDKNKKIAKLYNANKGFTGRMFANRKTYLIDENGVIIHEFKKVNVTQHAREVLDIFNSRMK